MKAPTFFLLFLAFAALQLSCLADEVDSRADGEERVIQFEDGQDDEAEDREQPHPRNVGGAAGKNGKDDKNSYGGRRGVARPPNKRLSAGQKPTVLSDEEKRQKKKPKAPLHAGAGLHSKRHQSNGGALDSLCPTIGPIINQIVSVLNSLPGGSVIVSLLKSLIDCSGPLFNRTSPAAAATTTASTAAPNGSTTATPSNASSGIDVVADSTLGLRKLMPRFY